jgi:hypothetical protein
MIEVAGPRLCLKIYAGGLPRRANNTAAGVPNQICTS